MTHPFPGGTSVSHLSVYDWPTTDGAGLVGGGTPHLHTASDEGYVVLAGSGSVQTLGPDGYAEHPLGAGTLLWFQPGVVHRLVNDGDLEILVVMSNAGLPEAGDAVMTFPADVLADAERYRAAATLPGANANAGAVPDPGAGIGAVPGGVGIAGAGRSGDAVTPDGQADGAVAAAARARRDLAVGGFGVLRDRVLVEGPEVPMGELYDAAARLVQDKVPGWQERWDSTVRQTTTRTADALEALAAGSAPHLRTAETASVQARPAPLRYGMCGRLRTWPL
ncbi:Cupin [Sanguibacter keddieii DSM 10542]|uniref:Cupin n=1 Tax=Sanguibacter keddieii (strain ATCC 51767 / DSM 10542 / NCFB 3025 / ST-74) TaxID=446469 RepID=D1BAG4_SANKS|nr:cupin domain-containing protein [Sanguibacter keddieii]ACZ20515.1 Cupin [Sanguibacter keddieii DSM 10542]